MKTNASVLGQSANESPDPAVNGPDHTYCFAREPWENHTGLDFNKKGPAAARLRPLRIRSKSEREEGEIV